MKTRLLILVLFALCFGTQKTIAQSGYILTWQGGSANWNNTGSWSITGAGCPCTAWPGDNFTNDEVIINSTVTVTTAANFGAGNSIYSLSIGAGKTVTIKLTSIASLTVINSISIGAGATLNLIGPGDLIGASDITLAAGATLTTTASPTQCDLTASTITTTNTTPSPTTITLNGKLTLSGALTVNTSGTTILTTNGAANTISGGITTNQTGATFGNLTWNGTGTTTVSGSNSNISKGDVFTVGANNNINFTKPLNLNGNSTLVAQLINNGNLTFTACALGGTAINPSAVAITNGTGASITLSASAASQINVPQYVTVSNSGTITANSGSSINLSSNPTTFINNAAGIVDVYGSGATGATFNLSNNFATLTNNGTMSFTVKSSLNLSAANTTATSNNSITFDASTLSLSVSPASFTNSSPGVCTFQNSSNLTMSGANATVTNSSTMNINSSTITMSNNPDNISNTSSGNMFLSSTAVNFTAASEVFANAGNLFLNSSPFSLTGSSGQFNNTGVVQSSASNFTLSTNTGSSINNSSGASFLYAGGTMLFSANSSSLNNSGTFQATGGTLFNFTATGSPGGSIVNNTGGTFNVGLDGSTNTITLASAGGKNTVTNNSIFNVGPLCTINMTSTAAQVNNNAAGTFTLLSTAAGSATIGQIASGAICGGLFNVQRFITGSSAIYRGYRLFSSPVNSTSATSGATNYMNFYYLNKTANVTGATNYNAPFTGGPGTGFTAGGIGISNPALYLYNESLPTSNSSFISGKNEGIYSISNAAGTPGVTTISSSGGTTVISPALGVNVPAGNGFLMFYVGDNTLGTGSGATVNASSVITNIGYINQQPVTVNLWFTPTGGSSHLSCSSAVGDAYHGYNMVGNPYPSTIDLHQVYLDNFATGVGQIFYELNNTKPNNQYVAWNGNTNASSGSPTTGVSEYIASGQGFLVTAASSTAVLTFKETEKPLVTTFPGFLLLNAKSKSFNAFNSAEPETLSIAQQPANTLVGLHLRMFKDTIADDECGIYFNGNNPDTFNSDDAKDLDGISPAVYLSSYTSDNVRTCINTLSGYQKGKRIKLYVNASASGAYSLKIADIFNVDTTINNIYIVDNLSKDSVDILKAASYPFTINTSDTTTYGANRFVLVFKRKPLPPYQLLTFLAKKGITGVQVNWKTLNEGTYTTFGLQKMNTDGQFALIDSVQSNSSSNYNYVDIKPMHGNNIYRLVQNDINGNVSYSSAININYDNLNSNGLFSIYPNPAINTITFSVTLPSIAQSTYTASIYNASGTLIDHRTVNTNTWTLDISAYKIGIYIIELKNSTGGLVGEAKFIKTN